MLTFISEFPVRAVLDDKEIVFIGQSRQHAPFFQGQRLARRILEIGDHIQELDLLPLSLDLLQNINISCPELGRILLMSHSSDISTV